MGTLSHIDAAFNSCQIDMDRACEVMHDAYEKAAKGSGWETNPASRLAWKDVPEANKEAMRAAVKALLDFIEKR